MHKALPILRYFLLLLFNPIWYLQLLIPRNKKIWIYGAWYGEKYSDNTKALYDYAVNNDKTIRSIWLTRKPTIKDRLTQEGRECFLVWSLKGVLLSLLAKKVIVCSSKKDVNPYFINGTIIVNTWHGCPMKRIGLDDEYNNNSKIKKQIVSILFPFICEWNYHNVVSTAPEFSKVMSSSFDIPMNSVLETGYPRNDILYSKEVAPYNLKLKETFRNHKLVYYLPTFRTGNGAVSIFNLKDYDEKTFSNFLEKENIVFVSKAHFVDKVLVGEQSDSLSRIIQLSDSETLDINCLMKDADLLITDYSGAYFDFLLTEKPILFAAFDLLEYQSKSRKMYFIYEEIISGPIATNWVAITENLKTLLTENNYASQIKEKKKRFNTFNDSDSSKRLFDEISKLC